MALLPPSPSNHPSPHGARRPSLGEERFHRRHQLIEVLSRGPPDCQVIHFRISVNEAVPHADNPVHVRNTLSDPWIEISKLAHRFAGNLELSLDTRSKEQILSVLLPGLARHEPSYPFRGCDQIPKQSSGSRLHRLPAQYEMPQPQSTDSLQRPTSPGPHGAQRFAPTLPSARDSDPADHPPQAENPRRNRRRYAPDRIVRSLPNRRYAAAQPHSVRRLASPLHGREAS